jgi:hypothetical protein
MQPKRYTFENLLSTISNDCLAKKKQTQILHHQTHYSSTHASTELATRFTRIRPWRRNGQAGSAQAQLVLLEDFRGADSAKTAHNLFPHPQSDGSCKLGGHTYRIRSKKV